MKTGVDWEAMFIAALGLVVLFLLMIGAEKAVGA